MKDSLSFKLFETGELLIENTEPYLYMGYSFICNDGKLVDIIKE